MVKYVLVLVLTTLVSALIVEGNERVSNVPYDDVMEPTYHVVKREYTTPSPKEYRTEITVSGNGIGEVYNVPYSVEGLNIIAYDELVVVRNRDKKNPLVVYSDTDNELIEFIGDETCKKITYKTVAGKTTSTKKAMGESECNEVMREIERAEKMATNPLKEFGRKMIRIAKGVIYYTPSH